MFRSLVTSAIVAPVVVCLALSASAGDRHDGVPASGRDAAASGAVRAGGLPLTFEANGGRTDKRARFIAHGGGYTLFITPRESVMALGDGRAVVRTRLVGARAARVEGVDRLAGKVNYLVGPQSRWRTGIPTFARVAARGVYPGVDLVYHGRQGAIEYDMQVAPGSDPAQIRLAVTGARSLRLDHNGDLLIRTHAGVVRQHRPLARQGSDPVRASFVLHGNRVGFRVGKFDRARPLLIDPQISYSSPYGGSDYDWGVSVAVDGSGSPYITGNTNSADFPTQGAFQSRSGEDAFVMKLTPDGTSQVYSTYIGGTSDDQGDGIAVDAGGHAYVAGEGGGGFPAGANAIGPRGGGDGWVAKLNPQGSGYDYFTVIGGTAGDFPRGIALDDSGQAYVGGFTQSSDFPGTGALSGSEDAMVFKLNAAGTGTAYSRYISGSANDRVYGIDVRNGEAYIAGASGSSNLPVTGLGSQAYQSGDGEDGFVAKLGTTGSIVYLGYVGGQDQQGTGPDNDGFVYDYLNDIAVAPDGSAWVIGYTESSSQPTSSTGLSDGLNGFDDLLIARISPTGGLDDAGFYGGSGGEDDAEEGRVGDVATDAQGNGYFASKTTSTNFPIAHAGNLQATGFGNDAVVFKLTAGSPLVKVFSTYLGGENGGESAYGIATSPSDGAVWVVGGTSSNDFPRVGTSRTLNAGGDAFVTKYGIEPVSISDGPGAGATVASRTPSFSFSSSEPSASYLCRTDANAFAPCSSPFAVSPLDQGPHTFDVRPVDLGGTPGAVASRAFNVDLSPHAALKISPNPMLAGRTATLDASGSTDNDPIAKFEWDVDGDGTFELDTGKAATTTQTYLTPGTFHVTVRVTDADGGTSTATGDLVVNALPSGTKPFGVSINNGARFTNTPAVKITANFPLATTSILVSNDGGFGNARTFLPLTSIPWTLDSSGPERLPKTVYVRFLPSAIAGLTFQDDIILDETPPRVESASIGAAAATAAIATAARKAKLRKWKLRVKASDKNSGVGGIQATSNKRKPGRLLRYRRKLTVKSAARPKWVRARDRAGNYSRWRRLR
jgi:hypothetical protein